MHIDNALYSLKSHKNFLSFKDICLNGYHIETRDDRGIEYLCIIKHNSDIKYVLEKLPTLSSGLYYTYISTTEAHTTVNQNFKNNDKVLIWHDRLGHPGYIMMRKLIENSCGHQLMSRGIIQSNKFSCSSCSQGKLIIRSSPIKIGNGSISFLERTHGDIYGSIHPSCGPFRYFYGYNLCIN